TLPAEDPLIPASQWTTAGQPIKKIDGRDFVTGRHKYPSDQKLPNMLHGKVVRPSAFNATLSSVDPSEAQRMSGVTVVRDGEFLGVVAPTPELAAQAATAVHAQWKAEPQPSNKELFEYLRKNQTEADDPTAARSKYETGDVDKAMASAAHQHKQT